MTTVSAGNTGTATLSAGDSVQVTLDQAEQAYVIVTDSTGRVNKFSGATNVGQIFGPFSAGDLLSVTALRGAVDFSIVPAPTNPALGYATTYRTLTGDYTLTAADDNVVFTATTALVVTVPAGLTPQPMCQFIPPGSGGITMRTSGTTFNGSTSDQIKTLTTDAYGFVLVGLGSNAYGLSGQIAFANVTGSANANASLVATFTQPSAIPGLAYSGITTKLTANHTTVAADCGAAFSNQSTSARSVIIAAGMPTNFYCWVWHDTASAVQTNINGQAGVTFVSKGSKTKLGNGTDGTLIHTGALVMCTGTADQYWIWSADLQS